MAKTAELRKRLNRLRAGMKRRRLDAMIIFDRPNAQYLTGFQSSLSFLLVTERHGRLLVDARYIEAAQKAVRHCKVELFKKLPEALKKWERQFKPRRIGLEGSIPRARWEEFARILPGVEWKEAGDLISKLRLIKSGEEIKRIEASAKMNDEVYEATLAQIQPGMTELDLRNFIRSESDRRGADGEAFECIVAAGVAGSMPHYHPGKVRLRRGDLLLIDMGLKVEGYCSDMTRVVALGEKPRARLQRAFEAVAAAEAAALRAVGPGVKAAHIHQVAVKTLKKYKIAKYFTHGLGHGVGLEVHEAPRINATSEDVLKPGMVVTIEPGVYLPGLGGVRIEDLAVVTRNGHRVLSNARKKFRIVPF